MIVFIFIFPDLLDHLRDLFFFFSLLTTNGVKLNLSKCTFGLKEVTFVGHRFLAEGSKPDLKTVEAVIKIKAPTRAKEVRRFLGMCGFYRKHVPSFAKIAPPLLNLTKSRVNFKKSIKKAQIKQKREVQRIRKKI